MRHLNIHQEYISFDEFRIDNQNTSEIGTYSGKILELGETVYSLTWETNYQGGNGVLSIVRVGNTYFYGAEEWDFNEQGTLERVYDL